MTYHFRKMTNKDLDLLYGHNDAKDWLIPNYGSRDFNIAVNRNNSNIAINSDETVMFFCSLKIILLMIRETGLSILMSITVYSLFKIELISLYFIAPKH